MNGFGFEMDIPEFLREAGDGESSAAAAWVEPKLLDALSLLPSLYSVPEVRSSERLVRAVEDWSLRHAPFFERVAELWALPVVEVEAVFAGARERTAWRRVGLRGVSVIDVQPGPARGSADCKLVRFAAGTRFPLHRHVGAETVFVLEGSYRDQDGRVYAAGDRQEMEAGTEHRICIDAGGECIAATVLHGLEFTGAPMRWLPRWFRRS